MATPLDRLLEEIVPERTLDAVAARVDRAVNSFPWRDRSRIEEPNHVRSLVARLFAHIESSVLDLNPPRYTDPAFDWSRAVTLLKRSYGEEAQYVTIERVLSGVDGGLVGVMRDLAALMAQDYAHNHIAACVSKFLQGLTSKQRIDAAHEYIEKYGKFLPSGFCDHGAPRLLMGFQRTLEHHPKLIQTIRRSEKSMRSSRF